MDTTMLNILKPFFRYSVCFPSVNDNVDHLNLDDENYDADMTGMMVPFALPPTIQSIRNKDGMACGKYFP
jgi:hypothetical protein